jgi:2-iminobutanoate/2-iminopropanoate deaminase
VIQRHFVAAAPPPPHGVKYSHASQAGGWLYVTGQLPSDPAAPAAPLPGGIEAQTEQTFKNLIGIVEAAGYRLSDTVFARLYLAQFERDYDDLNKVFYRYFADDQAVPSRTTVGVAKLGRGALIEIDLVLYKAP